MSLLAARTPSSVTPVSVLGLVRRLAATQGDSGALIARVMLGVVMLPHGAQKLFGAFGGYGYSATMTYFTDTMQVPAPLAFLAIMAESVGALALVLGLFGRIGAFGIGVTMTVAALTSHVNYGFFMNWFGSQAGEGIEYFLLAIALAAVVLVRGSGRWSIDRALFRAP